MRYRLGTLLIVTTIAPPILAVIWWFTQSIVGMLAFALFASFFVFWYWQLCRAQNLHPSTRGYPNYGGGEGTGGVGAW